MHYLRYFVVHLFGAKINVTSGGSPDSTAPRQKEGSLPADGEPESTNFPATMDSFPYLGSDDRFQDDDAEAARPTSSAGRRHDDNDDDDDDATALPPSSTVDYHNIPTATLIELARSAANGTGILSRAHHVCSLMDEVMTREDVELSNTLVSSLVVLSLKLKIEHLRINHTAAKGENSGFIHNLLVPYEKKATAMCLFSIDVLTNILATLPKDQMTTEQIRSSVCLKSAIADFNRYAAEAMLMVTLDQSNTTRMSAFKGYMTDAEAGYYEAMNIADGLIPPYDPVQSSAAVGLVALMVHVKGNSTEAASISRERLSLAQSKLEESMKSGRRISNQEELASVSSGMSQLREWVEYSSIAAGTSEAKGTRISAESVACGGGFTGQIPSYKLSDLTFTTQMHTEEDLLGLHPMQNSETVAAGEVALASLRQREKMEAVLPIFTMLQSKSGVDLGGFNPLGSKYERQLAAISIDFGTPKVFRSKFPIEDAPPECAKVVCLISSVLSFAEFKLNSLVNEGDWNPIVPKCVCCDTNDAMIMKGRTKTIMDRCQQCSDDKRCIGDNGNCPNTSFSTGQWCGPCINKQTAARRAAKAAAAAPTAVASFVLPADVEAGLNENTRLALGYILTNNAATRRIAEGFGALPEEDAAIRISYIQGLFPSQQQEGASNAIAVYPAMKQRLGHVILGRLPGAQGVAHRRHHQKEEQGLRRLPRDPGRADHRPHL